MIAHFDINLTMVFLRLSYGNWTCERVTFLNIACSVNVENYILPVSVGLIRRSTKCNLVFEVLKLTVKPRDKGTSSCALVEFKLVFWREVDVFFFHMNKIKIDDLELVAANHFVTTLVSISIQIVNAWFLKGYICHDWHIDAILILPEIRSSSLFRFIFNRCNIDLCSVW